MAAMMKEDEDEDEDAEPKEEPEEEEPAEEESEEESESEESEDETDSESSESEDEVRDNQHAYQFKPPKQISSLYRTLRMRRKRQTTIPASSGTTADCQRLKKATIWYRPMLIDCRTKSTVCARNPSRCRRTWTQCYRSWASLCRNSIEKCVSICIPTKMSRISFICCVLATIISHPAHSLLYLLCIDTSLHPHYSELSNLRL